MAGRPHKTSIDYAGWAVDIFDSEPKIDKLMDSQGCIGFTVYFFLCQRAYGSNGYFYPWGYDDSATTARKVGGGASAKSVEETVRYCLQIGLFEKRLFDEWKILTSRGIQKRYAQVALTRTNKSVISNYWLLTKEESTGLITAPLNPISPPDNSISPPDNSIINPKSKVKESKVEDEERACARDPSVSNRFRGVTETITDGPDPELTELARQKNAALEQIEALWIHVGNGKFSGHDCTTAERLIDDHSLPWILEAMTVATNTGKCTWQRIGRVMQKFKEQGGPDSTHGRQKSAADRSENPYYKTFG